MSAVMKGIGKRMSENKLTEDVIDALLPGDTCNDLMGIVVMGWYKGRKVWMQDPYFWHDSQNKQLEHPCLTDTSGFVVIRSWSPSEYLDDFTLVEQRIAELGLQDAYLSALIFPVHRNLTIDDFWDRDSQDSLWQLLTASPLDKCKAALKAVSFGQQKDG